MSSFRSPLSRFSLKAKISIAVIPLALATMFFAFERFQSDRERASDAGQTEQMAEFSVAVSSLAHEVQRERAFSTLFVGSKGASFGNELKEQRELTDERLASYEQFREEFDPASYGPAYVEAARGIEDKFIPGLMDTRRKVDTLAIAPAEVATTFTSLIAITLQGVAPMAGRTTDAELARQATIYTNFLWAKELTGQERATLNAALSRGTFNAGEFQKWVTLTSGQDIRMLVVESLARDEEMKAINDQVSGPAVEAV
ncbi:hypothetical protein EDM76_12760, partial [bacterium]